MAVGIVFVSRARVAGFTRFTDRNGPIFAGKIFLLLHHHCLRRDLGFHALISSGTTPK
jgi:carbon starvation protein CstA